MSESVLVFMAILWGTAILESKAGCWTAGKVTPGQ